VMPYRYICFTILHSEVTMTAEVGLLYRYIMCDDAVTQSSSAEMNRVLTAQLQANVSHGEHATLLLIHFSTICQTVHYTSYNQSYSCASASDKQFHLLPGTHLLGGIV